MARYVNPITLLASGARSADGNSQSDGKNAIPFKVGLFFLKVTAKSGTTPTLDVDIISYDPYTEDWFVIGSFTQVGDETGKWFLKIDGGLGQEIATAWDVEGGTPNYTFSVSGILKAL